MVLSADLHKAIVATWTASTLDSDFQAYWGSDVTVSDHVVLHDEEAAAGQPFPYCIFQVSEGSTDVKMSGRTSTSRQEVKKIPVEFHIHARSRNDSSVNATAKTIAATLMELVCKVFGGHPTTRPSAITLDNGNVLQSDLTSEYGMREDDNNYKWILRYSFTVDVPVAD